MKGGNQAVQAQVRNRLVSVLVQLRERLQEEAAAMLSIAGAIEWWTTTTTADGRTDARVKYRRGFEHLL